MTKAEQAVVDAARAFVRALDSDSKGAYVIAGDQLVDAVRALPAPEVAAVDTTGDRERWHQLFGAAIAGMSALPHDDGTGGSVICIVEDAIHLADRALAAEKARWPR